MNYIVLKTYRDRDSKKVLRAGESVTYKAARGNELIKAGYLAKAEAATTTATKKTAAE